LAPAGRSRDQHPRYTATSTRINSEDIFIMAPLSPRVNRTAAILGAADIPADPTVELSLAERLRVRAELAAQVRAAGTNWAPVIECHLRRYGVWVDPRTAERQRAQEVQAAEQEIRARAEERELARPATRAAVRAVERTLAVLARDLEQIAKAVVVIERRACA
jgi:hypothetical protein